MKVKDNARENVRDLIIECEGIDIEDDDCPEFTIEMYCDEMNIKFDSEGRIVNVG